MANAGNQPIAYLPPNGELSDRLRRLGSGSGTELQSNLTKLSITRKGWDDVLGSSPAHEINRLHYYQLPGLSYHSPRELGEQVFTSELGNFRDHPYELAAKVFDGTYLYVFLRKQTTDDSIAAIAVFRPNSDVFAIRVREDDLATTVFNRLRQDFEVPSEDYRGPDGDQPAFNKRFHTQFENDLVDRYDRIWIAFDEETTDDVLNKIQFLADGQNDAKDSDYVKNVLSDEGTKIYGGRVEASDLALTDPRTFFFNWDQKRVTFQQRPNERTKLEISDSLIRVYDRVLSPPLDRVLNPGTTAVRVEFYEDRNAATWQTYTSLSQFRHYAIERLGEDAQTIVYYEEGRPTVTELSSFDGEIPEQLTFVRVEGEQQALTWEPEATEDENRYTIGLVSKTGRDDLVSAYEETVEGGGFSERVEKRLADISQEMEVAE